MLTSSVELESFRNKNCDLERDLSVMERRMEEMSVKYEKLEDSFVKKLEEKRFECEKIFYQEMEQDKMKWKQSSDQIIYDLM